MKKILSYGGGLDSFAMLLDAVSRGELPDVVVFLDVGDGSPERDGEDPGEWPGTYRHISEVVIPLCAELGIPFEWLTTERYPVRDARSLFSWLWARYQIPTAKGRVCTTIAKVERFERWVEDTFGGDPVEVWIGFEAGEEDRTAKDPNAASAATWRKNRFPLQERGLCRCRCEALVRASGHPIPRKSACVFCPMGSRADWRTLARELPDTFAKLVEMEARKPLTSNGAKLSIRDFASKPIEEMPKRGRGGWTVSVDGKKAFRPTMLPEYVASAGRPAKPLDCKVCGAKERATKVVGCGYLQEGRAA